MAPVPWRASRDDHAAAIMEHVREGLATVCPVQRRPKNPWIGQEAIKAAKAMIRAADRRRPCHLLWRCLMAWAT
eukprot:1144683-Alexandrium_andersonii.AAC.1